MPVVAKVVSGSVIGNQLNPFPRLYNSSSVDQSPLQLLPGEAYYGGAFSN